MTVSPPLATETWFVLAVELGGVAGATGVTVGVVFTGLGALTAGPVDFPFPPAGGLAFVGLAGWIPVLAAGPALAVAVFVAAAFVDADFFATAFFATAFFVAVFVAVFFAAAFFVAVFVADALVAGKLRARDLAAGRGRVFAMGASVRLT